MQVVFVHGVANRRAGDVSKETEFDRTVENRNRLFNEWVFGGKAKFHNPYWGDLGGQARYGKSSVPKKGGQEAFGEPGEPAPMAIAGDPKFGFGLQGAQLLSIALRDRALFVDLVLTASESETKDSDEFLALATRLSAYQDQGDWSWLATVQNDQGLMDRLAAEVNAFQPPAGTEAFGIGDLVANLRNGVKKAVGSVIDKTSDALMLKFKPAITNGAVMFLGDAFVYLDTRNKPDELNPIAARVLADLQAAWQAKAPGEKLVVVVHSYGGTVLWDLLTFYKHHLPPGFKIDAVLSAGTQVGLFLEMDVYGVKLKELGVVPPAKVPLPDSVATWINVFDFGDPLGFCLEPMLQGCQDFEFNTGGSLLNSHNLYFTMAQFYKRAKVRLTEAGVI